MRFSLQTQTGYPEEFGYTTLPSDIINITDEEFEQINNLKSHGLIIQKNGNNFIGVDPTSLLTEDERKALQAAALKAQAQQLLKDNDYRWSNQFLMSSYSQANKVKLQAYYFALVAVVNGISNTIPILDLDE